MVKEIRQYGGGSAKSSAVAAQKPSAEEVDNFHTNSDLDIRAESLHHSLGTSATQAAAGNHNHDGGNSVALLADLSITGSRATDAWRLSVNALLVKLGAEDNSTA
jgi:hypothetical protein